MSTQLLITSRSSNFEYITRVESRVLAMVVLSLLLRNILLDEWNYLFLVWNLFLAYVPLLIQQLSLKHVKPKSWGQLSLMLVWLLFLPNAPYIVSDLIHPFYGVIEARVVGLPLGFLSVMSAAILGLLWYLRSLSYFDHQLNLMGLNVQLRRGAIALVSLATGCGVWMGRSLRLNTWDVVTKPWEVVVESANFLSAPMYAEWALVSALLLWATWRAYERWSWIGEVVE